MTVVPDDDWMQLICNGCGDTVEGPAQVLPDAEVVWTFISEHGWSGSPFAAGPHRCPRCALAPPPGISEAQQNARRDDHRPGHDAHPATAPDVEHLGGVAVVTVAGDIDVATGEALHTALAGATADGGQVLVDLTQVRLIDSTGLGLLVRAHRQARERGGRLCLAAPSRFILTVLHTMRLDGVFPIFDSRHEALRRLAPAPEPTRRTGTGSGGARSSGALSRTPR